MEPATESHLTLYQPRPLKELLAAPAIYFNIVELSYNEFQMFYWGIIILEAAQPLAGLNEPGTAVVGMFIWFGAWIVYQNVVIEFLSQIFVRRHNSIRIGINFRWLMKVCQKSGAYHITPEYYSKSHMTPVSRKKLAASSPHNKT